MDAKYYIDACMEELGISSRYALWKATDIPEARLSDYYKGDRIPDEFACFKFAEILGLDPSLVIAEIQASNKKNPDKALFFKSFLTAVGLWIILAVIPSHFSTFSGNAYANGNAAETRMDITYKPIIRSRKYLKTLLSRLLTLLKNERYFTCNWHVKFSSLRS